MSTPATLRRGLTPAWVAALPWLSSVARLGLVAVWGYAGYSKVADPAATVRAVRAYRLLPEVSVHTIGYALPFVEMALALLLLAGIGVRACGWASAVLLTLFMIGVASAGLRGLHIDCGCFGGGGQVQPGATRYLSELARDALFLGLAAWLVAFPASRLAVDLSGPAVPASHPEPEETS